MRLKKVILNNFRCFRQLEVDLHPQLTVIVGENGSGKTAILDGIATALSPVLTHFSSANQRLAGRGIKDTDFRIESWEGREGKERWGAADYTQVVAQTLKGLQWDYWRPSSSGKEPHEKHGEKQLKDHVQRIAESYKSATPELTPVFAYYGARRGYIEVPERLRTAKQIYEHPTAALIGALDSMSDFREMLAWFDLEESSELRKNKGVSREDFEESQSLSAVRASVVELLGGAFQNPHFNKDHKFVLERQTGGAPILVSQLSQGYQSMLALAMDFSRRMAIANGHLTYGDDACQTVIDTEMTNLALLDPTYASRTDEPFAQALSMSAPAIMLVDEIDLHLHPLWQQRVLGDLMRTFPLTQFIVTTHSPQVLSTVRRENIRIISQTEDGHKVTLPDFSPLAQESGDALSKIMGVQRQPPLPLLDSVLEFEQLVVSGQEDTDTAHQLRQKLDTAGYQIHPSNLITWRFLAQRKTHSQG